MSKVKELMPGDFFVFHNFPYIFIGDCPIISVPLRERGYSTWCYSIVENRCVHFYNDSMVYEEPFSSSYQTNKIYKLFNVKNIVTTDTFKNLVTDVNT